MVRSRWILGLVWLLFLSSVPLAAGEGFVIPRAGLNVRETPGIQGKKSGTLPFDTLVEILSMDGPEEVREGSNGRWFEVRSGHLTGWVHGNYIQRTFGKESSQGGKAMPEVRGVCIERVYRTPMASPTLQQAPSGRPNLNRALLRLALPWGIRWFLPEWDRPLPAPEPTEFRGLSLNVFFPINPPPGASVTLVPMVANLPILERKLQDKPAEQAEDFQGKPVWITEVAHFAEPGYLAYRDPDPGLRADCPFRVCVIFPPVSFARFVPPEKLASGSLPESELNPSLSLVPVAGAVDLTEDGIPDILEYEITEDDHTFSELFIKKRGHWILYSEVGPM